MPRMGGRGGAGHNHRHQADIGAAADALQHQMADTDRGLDPAPLQGIGAGLIEAGLGKIAKALQRPRGVAGADEKTVAGKGGDRRVDVLHQSL